MAAPVPYPFSSTRRLNRTSRIPNLLDQIGMHTGSPSEEISNQNSSQEEYVSLHPPWMSAGNSRPLTYEVLQEEWERVESWLPEHLGLRVHRALSWVKRAEREADDDPDAAFIFYWIAFNAAYAQDRPRSLESTERDHFADFFDTILTIDSGHMIYDAIWERFSDSIRVLLNNKFVFQPFWNHYAGRGYENWEHIFENSKKGVHGALAARDTSAILSTLFDRLYVLRIQLMHGGASWRSSVNRDQVRDGARILAFLVPLFVGLMMSRPDIQWGQPDYPVVN